MDLNTPPLASRRCLHISVVTETYPPDINGVAFTVARWVEALRRRGHRLTLVQVAREREPPDAADADALRLPGFTLPGYSQVRAGWPAYGALSDRWRRHRPDLAHIVTEGPLGYSALCAARRLRIPVSTSFHTHFQHYSRHYRLGWLSAPITAYLRHFHNRALQTLVPTAELVHQLQALGFQRVRAVARGVDTALFSPQRRDPLLRQHWGLTARGLAVLYVGRLAAEKNLELLIAAFEAIRRTRPDARLILVGDGPVAARARARHPHFVHCGMREGETLATHYASADLFLFPSLTETFGNVVLEAMASGLAVVAFDYAAARAHLNSGRNGLSIPFGDKAAFVGAAVALAREPARLENLGRAARQSVERLDSERIYDRLEASFLQLVSGEPSCSTASLAT